MQIETPELKEGEIYIGAVVNPDGTGYRSVLLPGDNDDADFETQKDWAASIGGELPNRIEQAILFDKFRDQFKKDWYWSGVEHESNTSYAWYQDFNDGFQCLNHKGYELRARAVRRLPI